ncbi:sterol desaturase family protein [Castellaniella caeni]|uniref:sterol desaturase family protein n=1 Tax=Castellaniella caeni TaxID=266123 RepID=UPI00083333BC|nr:sterol desaturase family protein [Castellaniella caeni]
MTLFKLEQHPAVYFADFVLYPVAILAGVSLLAWRGQGPIWAWLLVAALGFFAWSFIEYAMHRFVFHGVQPFKRWHDEHHRRPFALIGSSTLVSMALFAGLIFWPLSLLVGASIAGAATLGVIVGYLLYVVVHHATHHWKARPGSWMAARKQDHARHHMPGVEGWYGVTTPFWDHVFSTDTRPANRR